MDAVALFGERIGSLLLGGFLQWYQTSNTQQYHCHCSGTSTRQAIHNNSSVIGRKLAVEVLYFGDERVVVVAYIKMFRGNCNRRV